MSAKHFVFKRHAVVSTPEGLIVGKSQVSVPEDVIRMIPMTADEAQKLISSLSPGMLHLLNEGGGSPRFSRALQLTGNLK